MTDNTYLYTTGEFAKLMGVNKRTLHYYNDIGLFCPEKSSANGYHYYSIFQFADFEMILTLRQLGVSIEDLKSYFKSDRKDVSFSNIMKAQNKIIDEKIEELLCKKDFLNIKAQRLKLSMQAKDSLIKIENLPERHIILSSPLSECQEDEKDLGIAADFSLKLKQRFKLYDSFGTRIKLNNIIEESYSKYDKYYAYCPKLSDDYDCILPSGKYLMAYNKGHWNKRPSLYKKILKYAKDNNLCLGEYSYEEGLNDLSLKNIDDYITLITIKIEE